jgi:predicted amidohydrolase YtcJ
VGVSLDASPGVHAAWHVDWPVPVVQHFDAMQNLYGFVTRNEVAEDGRICEAPDFLKNGAINADEALHIMTIGSAYALFREDEIGSLEPGKLADIVITSDNPLDAPSEAIKDIRVLMTMIGGDVEYCEEGSERFCPN